MYDVQYKIIAILVQNKFKSSRSLRRRIEILFFYVSLFIKTLWTFENIAKSIIEAEIPIARVFSMGTNKVNTEYLTRGSTFRMACVRKSVVRLTFISIK